MIMKIEIGPVAGGFVPIGGVMDWALGMAMDGRNACMTILCHTDADDPGQMVAGLIAGNDEVGVIRWGEAPTVWRCSVGCERFQDRVTIFIRQLDPAGTGA